MEKPSGLSVIQGLHLYLVEARVGQCDSTHIAFCNLMSSKYESQRKEQCVCYICWFSSFCSKRFFPRLQPIFPTVQEFSQGYDRQRTTRHSFSTLPMICSYQCCIQSLSFSQMFSYKPVPPKTLQTPKVTDHYMSTYKYRCKELFHKIQHNIPTFFSSDTYDSIASSFDI